MAHEHDYAEYACPNCEASLCYSCNPKDERGSWHGECRCPDCNAEIVAGNFN